MDPTQTVVLKRFESRTEANIVAAALESDGIKTVVISDDCGGMFPSLSQGGGVGLRVSQQDLKQAEDLLSNLTTSQD